MLRKRCITRGKAPLSQTWAAFAVLACGLWLCVANFATAADSQSPNDARGLIMIDKIGGHIRFFDPLTDQEVSSFAASREPGMKAHELVISPDRRTAYTTVYGDGIYGKNPNPGHAVLVIDLASGQLTATIDLSPYQAPHGIAIDASGMLYVACDLSRKVLVIDPAKRSVEAVIDVEGTGHRLAVLPDASKLYVSNKDDRRFISVVDLKLRKMVGKIPMPNGTEGIVASPDGKTVLAADLTEPYVHVIATATDTEVARIRVQGVDKGIYNIFYTPDGQRVLTCTMADQINIFTASDLHAPQKIVKSGGTQLMGIAFTADSKSALVGNHGQGTVSRIELDTATLKNTFPAGKGVESLAYF
jgi:hypothetical protein